MTQPNNPSNPGGQRQQRGGPSDPNQHGRDRSAEDAGKQGSKGYGGGSSQEKHPGGKALDINGPAGGGDKGNQGSRRDDR